MFNSMDDKQKIKNIKDLDYNHALNKQNIALVLIGTAILYVIFTDTSSINIQKSYLLFFLILAAIIFMWYFGRELNKIKEEIKNL